MRKKAEVIKRRGGPYTAKPIYGASEAWFYTNGGSITIVSRRSDVHTASCKIPLRTLKRIVSAMTVK